MSKFLHDNADTGDGDRAMTIPQRFLKKTAKLKMAELIELYSKNLMLKFGQSRHCN